MHTYPLAFIEKSKLSPLESKAFRHVVPAEGPIGPEQVRQNRIALVPSLGEIGLEVAWRVMHPSHLRRDPSGHRPDKLILEPLLEYGSLEHRPELGERRRPLTSLHEVFER